MEVNLLQNDFTQSLSQRPDLNPIEILWNELREPFTPGMLKIWLSLSIFVEELSKIHAEFCEGQIHSYWTSLFVVIAAKEGLTSY